MSPGKNDHFFQPLEKNFYFWSFFQFFFDESIFYTLKSYLSEGGQKMLPLTPPFDPEKLGETLLIVRYALQSLIITNNKN